MNHLCRITPPVKDDDSESIFTQENEKSVEELAGKVSTIKKVPSRLIEILYVSDILSDH